MKRARRRPDRDHRTPQGSDRGATRPAQRRLSTRQPLSGGATSLSRMSGESVIDHVWPQFWQLIARTSVLLTTSVPRGVTRACWHLGQRAAMVVGNYGIDLSRSHVTSNNPNGSQTFSCTKIYADSRVRLLCAWKKWGSGSRAPRGRFGLDVRPRAQNGHE